MTVNSTTKPLILRRVSDIPDSSVKAYVDLLLRCNEDRKSDYAADSRCVLAFADDHQASASTPLIA